MFQRCNGFLVISVTQCVRCIPQQASAFCPLHRTAFELLPELFIRQIEEIRGVTFRGYVLWLKGRFGRGNAASLAEWTAFLADVPYFI